MALENSPPRKSELPQPTFDKLAVVLGEHIEYADSQHVTTSVSLQNGFHFNSKFHEHEVVDLGEQESTFAASHAKLAVVAFKLANGPLPLGKDDKRDIVAMLKYSDNGAFIRQKRDIAPEVVAFAREEIGMETDILTIREDGTSISGETTARDSLKLFIRMLQIARQTDDSHDIREALAENNSKYGVRARFKPHKGIKLLNKTGDYFGQEDPEIGEAVHHDVGVLYTTGQDKQRLGYSITSSADTRPSAWNANRLNKHIAKTLLETIGGAPKSRLAGALTRFRSEE